MIPRGVCEFCRHEVSIAEAVIFGPDVVPDAELADLADRWMAQDPEVELVLLHPECEALIEGGSS